VSLVAWVIKLAARKEGVRLSKTEARAIGLAAGYIMWRLGGGKLACLVIGDVLADFLEEIEAENRAVEAFRAMFGEEVV